MAGALRGARRHLRSVAAARVHAQCSNRREGVGCVRGWACRAHGLPPATVAPRRSASARAPPLTRTRRCGHLRHQPRVDAADLWRRWRHHEVDPRQKRWSDEVTTSTRQDPTRSMSMICRKLGLRPGMRLLDVGCGWGGMACMHARQLPASTPSGSRLSRAQRNSGGPPGERQSDGRAQFRLQDYPPSVAERFGAISSIGMFEHVGEARSDEYTTACRPARAQGRLLDHGIAGRPAPTAHIHRAFIDRYVFPDGELHEVGRSSPFMQERVRGARRRDPPRALRPHALRAWVANLERNWDAAVARGHIADEDARVWRLYMAASASTSRPATPRCTRYSACGPTTVTARCRCGPIGCLTSTVDTIRSTRAEALDRR